MLVVSDTSPITALLQISRMELLRDLFGIVLVPNAVHRELLQFHATIPTFVQIKQVQDAARVQTFLASLDLGEAEAIVLSLESRADYLLIDERRGRQLAIDAGVPVIGLIGVILLAKTRGLVPSVKDTLIELQIHAGFYLSDALFQMALDAANE